MKGGSEMKMFDKNETSLELSISHPNSNPIYCYHVLDDKDYQLIQIVPSSNLFARICRKNKS